MRLCFFFIEEMDVYILFEKAFYAKLWDSTAAETERTVVEIDLNIKNLNGFQLEFHLNFIHLKIMFTKNRKNKKQKE